MMSPNCKEVHSETIFLEKFIQDYEESCSQCNADIMLEVKDKNPSFVKIDLFFNPSQGLIVIIKA